MDLFIVASLLIVVTMATVLLFAIIFYAIRNSRDCAGNCNQGRRPCDCRKQ